MILPVLLAASRAFVLAPSAATVQTKAPLLVNPAFREGLKGWTAEGDARIVDGSLVLGPGKAAVRQRYDVPGLRVLWFGATLKPSGPEAASEVRVQCFDARGRRVMDQKAPPNAKAAAGIYMKTQANTAYVIVAIEKTSDVGAVVADDAVLLDYDKDRVEHAPQIDLDAAMRPIWKGGDVLHESVLLLSKGGNEPAGSLMFRPTEVRSVRDATLAKEYVQGKDFRIDGRRIVALKGSSIPTMSDSEFAKGELPWTVMAGRHVFVTYEHEDRWSGPVPAYQGDRLPETERKLRAKAPVTIVAYGDSITHGINVSGARDVPPYLPPWASLFAREVGRRSGAKIRFYNPSLSGANSDWAKEYAHDAVAALDPDLVVLAFGMNDFWGLSPTAFRANIESTMATIRAQRPKCEFILVTSMRFDPAYTTDPTYVGRFDGYADELRGMAGPGVALVDMTAMSEALYRAKSPKDLETDPMHPDDFLARWYAQSLVATVVRR